MAQTKKNVTMHPVNNGVIDQNTDLFPRTLTTNILDPDTETAYPFDTLAKKTEIKDGTLSVKVNGTQVGSFSANQSTNTEIDISTGGAYTAGQGVRIDDNEISVEYGAGLYIGDNELNVFLGKGLVYDSVDAINIDHNNTLAFAQGSSQIGVNTEVIATQDQITTLTSALAEKVSGPSSSTDNAIARFDSTTGKVIQNSMATITDTGIINANGINLEGSGLSHSYGDNIMLYAADSEKIILQSDGDAGPKIVLNSAGTGNNITIDNITVPSGTTGKTFATTSDLDGKEDTSNKVALGSTNTTTQYPNAKSVYDECVNIRSVAEGKCKSYVIQSQSDITGTKGTDDQYTNVTAITGVTLSELKIGDVILIKDLNVPDYWVSQITPSYSLNKLETSKVDISGKIDGPSSSTDNAIMRFDGTTGKVAQNSGWTINDSDVISKGNFSITPGDAVTISNGSTSATQNTLALFSGGAMNLTSNGLNINSSAAITINASMFGITFGSNTGMGSYASYAKMPAQDGSTSSNPYTVATREWAASNYQSIITTTNKLSSDLVDDTDKTNKFVTSTEKEAWNDKQDALTTDQMSAVNSGITSSKVTTYDGYATSKQNTIDDTHKLSADLIINGTTNIIPTLTEKTAWNAKSKVSASSSGTSANTINYITIDDTEYKLPVGGTGTSDFDVLLNRPSYNGTVMTHETNIPEVKTTVWDNKSIVSVSATGTATDEVEYITVDGTEKKLPKLSVTVEDKTLVIG